MRSDEAYIRTMEARIRNQRAQLRWWQDMFERGDLRPRKKGWPASRVCDLLRRLGSPHRVDDVGRVTKRVAVKLMRPMDAETAAAIFDDVEKLYEE